MKPNLGFAFIFQSCSKYDFDCFTRFDDREDSLKSTGHQSRLFHQYHSAVWLLQSVLKITEFFWNN